MFSQTPLKGGEIVIEVMLVQLLTQATDKVEIKEVPHGTSLVFTVDSMQCIAIIDTVPTILSNLINGIDKGVLKVLTLCCTPKG